jgi:hypothetical protein
MTKRKALVIGQLEDVSWQVVEEYKAQIVAMVKGKSGIYALYRHGKLYYVGLASNLMGRLKQHQRDRHENKWDRFSLYITKNDEHMKELESLFLRILKPEGNKVKGKFAKSENLGPSLNRMIKAAQDDSRAAIMGGRLAKRILKNKTVDLKGSGSLVGLVPRRLPLRAWYKGYEYRASLLKSGVISYDGDKYLSPSAAAKIITKGGGVNGWIFWHYKGADGDWVRLRNLRS